MTHDEPNPAYETVAAAIRFVRGHALTQPSLNEVAHHVGLSASHLQRVFSEWAGISPKRFLQFLTKENAKSLLRESRDVLSAAIESGLSGPGRLHDLMVNCDALTPGEIGALGEGLMIRYGFAASPFGAFIVGTTAHGICHLRFVEAGQADAAEADMQSEWPHAGLERDDAMAQQLATDLFSPFSQPKPLNVLLRGTNFQIKVWEALLRIPAGHALSYSDLATMAALPNAQRAVGTAMAHNNIAVLIPCHRVIRENGEAGLYRWGTERKRAIIGWEQSRRIVRSERETECALQGCGELYANREDGGAFNLFEAAEFPDNYFPLYVHNRPHSREEIVLAVAKALYYGNPDVIPITEERRNRMKKVCKAYGFDLDAPGFDPAIYG